MGPEVLFFFIHIRYPLELWGRDWEFQILYGKLWWGDRKSFLRWTNGEIENHLFDELMGLGAPSFLIQNGSSLQSWGRIKLGFLFGDGEIAAIPFLSPGRPVLWIARWIFFVSKKFKVSGSSLIGIWPWNFFFWVLVRISVSDKNDCRDCPRLENSLGVSSKHVDHGPLMRNIICRVESLNGICANLWTRRFVKLKVSIWRWVWRNLFALCSWSRSRPPLNRSEQYGLSHYVLRARMKLASSECMMRWANFEST